MPLIVRQATFSDLEGIAAIHKNAFLRQTESVTWVKATLSAAPRLLTFVLTQDEEVIGFIFWSQKSGIRSSAVLELDQIAIAEQFQQQGHGERLIRDSFSLVAQQLAGQGQSVKSVLVSTRADNDAQRLYAKVFGARVVASIDGLYSSTEVLMLGTPPDV